MTIAGYIKSDLQVRLRTGRGIPTGLTLESLANHYDVSLTPVRAAVRELVAEGFLRKGTNRRLEPVDACVVKSRRGRPQTARPLMPPEPPRDLLKVIGDDLVRLSLGGEAVTLREEAAARQYGVSRTVIRNVFHRLAGIGLISHTPRRGWSVRPFRPEDMRAFLDVRAILELRALELAAPRLVAEDLQAMLDRNVVPASDDEWPRIDHGLHAYVIEKSGNPYIKDFLERHGRYYEILFDWEDRDRVTAVETVRRHREILEAILGRNWPAARDALSRDIRCGHPLLGSTEGNQTPPFPD